MPETSLKAITGYCEPWSLRAGETITLFSSSHSPGPANLSLVRIHCGDPTSYGPGYSEAEISSDLPSTVELADQPLRPGSYVTVDLQGLSATGQIGSVIPNRKHLNRVRLRRSMSHEQIQHAKTLVEGGEPKRKVARLFKVSTATLYRALAV